MIVHPAEHLFECMFPSLEDHEQEVFYQHPTWPIKCNQLGVLYYDEAIISAYEKKDKLNITHKATLEFCGTKPKVVWECYHGKEVKGSQFHYVNANPYDLRKENLVLAHGMTQGESARLNRVKRRFRKATLARLLEIESKMHGMGFTSTDTWEILKIPYWLEVERRKFKEAPIVEGKCRRGGSRAKATDEERLEVSSLFKLGWSYPAIKTHMDWGSVTRVKNIVRDLGLTR
jgi:hypothetical protein